MALAYILKEFSKEVGLPFNTSSDRAAVIEKINKAARELYSTTDLVGSLREQVFDIDPSKLQMTLPYYVDKLRGVRHYDTRSRVKVEDMRPRYFYGREWPQKYLTWRHKNQLSTCRELENTTQLAIVLQTPETERFKVTIVGSTSLADRVSETVTVEPGIDSVLTTNQFTNFPGIQLISKDKIISQNVSIQDASGNEIANIANCELESRYTLVAVGDYQNSFNCDCFEILYKYKFSPFYNDYDVFPAPDYDDAIIYKASSHYWSRDTSQIGQAKVIEYETKCANVLTQRAMDGESSEEKEMQFGRNPYMDLQAYGYPSGFSDDVPTRVF